ncbi:DUF3293 domain-containing protein [Deinococcus kurensis]|uniref:DUF3293 domain-containing protein n=1 Tax=Deinococcus kurensis TaxID=2662757 RepID=UPI001F1D5197|nr:DUF3293 domain-containing protein [Deinococcus kurensis]
MNPELRAAFLASAYGRAGERLHLTPAGPGASPDWAAAGQRWAILTAWNPGAQPTSADLNRARQAQLTAEAQSWAPLPGWNGEGAWREDTVILRGVPLPEAVRLGRRFGQAAVVWGVGRRAALVWLDGPVLTQRRWLTREPARDGR